MTKVCERLIRLVMQNHHMDRATVLSLVANPSGISGQTDDLKPLWPLLPLAAKIVAIYLGEWEAATDYQNDLS